MEQRNSEKKFNSRADIMTRYNFNQVRWFFLHLIDFMV